MESKDPGYSLDKMRGQVLFPFHSKPSFKYARMPSSSLFNNTHAYCNAPERFRAEPNGALYEIGEMCSYLQNVRARSLCVIELVSLKGKEFVSKLDSSNFDSVG